MAVLNVLGRPDRPPANPWCEQLYARARSAAESTAVDAMLALPNPNKQSYANPSFCGDFRLAKQRAAIDASSSPVAGGLYAVEHDSGGYDIVKVLAVDSSAVHVRIYSDHFAEVPRHIDPAALHLYGITMPSHDTTSQTPQPRLGIGHLPITHSQFAAWQPRFVQRDSVRETELEGYRLWKESGGGVFP